MVRKVNVIGSQVPVHEESELHEIMKTLGMEYIKTPVSYDYSKIEENYKQIFEKLLELNMVTPKDVQAARMVLENKKGEARKAVEQAKELIKKEKIYLDDSEFANPFPVAKFLIEQGFRPLVFLPRGWNIIQMEFNKCIKKLFGRFWKNEKKTQKRKSEE